MVVRKFGLVAFADEKPEEGKEEKEEPSASAPTINYEDLITKARMDEKNKQYNKIKKLQEQVEDLTKKQNELLLKVGSLEQEKDEAERKLTEAKSGDNEEVKTLKAEIDKLKGELESAKKKVTELESVEPVDRDAVEKEVREAVEKEYEVKLYRQEVLAPYANDKTVVTDLVFGETKEAIDASLKAALERSKEIKSSLGLTLDGSEDKRKTSRTPVSGANPSVATGGGMSNSSMEQLAKLDPRSKEYAELRRKLGM